MPINRLYTPAQIPTVQPFVLPYEQIGQGLLAAQGQQDAATGLLDEIGNITFNYNQKDTDLANAQYAEIDKFQEDLLNRSGNGDLRKLTGDIKSYARNVASKFRPNNAIGALQADYNARTKFVEQVNADKDVSGFIKQAAIAHYDEMNPGVTKAGTGYVGGYKAAPLSKEVAIPKRYEEYVAGVMASEGITVRETADGVGYFRQTKYGVKQVTPEQIISIVNGYKGADTEYQASRNQLIKFGIYDEPTMQAVENNALLAAINKHAYKNITDEKTMSADSTATWSIDRAERLAKEAAYLNFTKLEINNDLSKQNKELLGTPKFDNKGQLIYNVETKPDGSTYNHYGVGTIGESVAGQTARWEQTNKIIQNTRLQNPRLAGMSDKQVYEYYTNSVQNSYGKQTIMTVRGVDPNGSLAKYTKGINDNLKSGGINQTFYDENGNATSLGMLLKEFKIVNKDNKFKNLTEQEFFDNYISGGDMTINGTNAGAIEVNFSDGKKLPHTYHVKGAVQLDGTFESVQTIYRNLNDMEYHNRALTNPGVYEPVGYNDVYKVDMMSGFDESGKWGTFIKTTAPDNTQRTHTLAEYNKVVQDQALSILK
jgi:hypothetical protein